MVVRRSLRQSLLKQGFKSNAECSMREKKKPRRCRAIQGKYDVSQPSLQGKGENVETPSGKEGTVTPHTPIHLLQQIGRSLQIPEEEMTEERLDAQPAQDQSNGSDDK